MDNKINEINQIISKELWFDFEIKSFDGGTLVVIGGLDLYYNWLIELTFTNVDFISSKSDWMRKDNMNAIDILTGDKEQSIKATYFIEKSCLLFAFNHRDFDTDNQYLVASTGIDYKINNT